MSRSDRSGLATTLLVLVLGAAGLLVAGAGAWVTGVQEQPPPLPQVVVEEQAAAPAVRALGVLVLAAAPALLAVRGRGRVVVGGVVLLAACLAAVAAYPSAASPARQLPDGAGAAASTARPYLALASALPVAVAGLLAVSGGRRWPSLGRRYDRSGQAGGAPVGTSPAAPEVDRTGPVDGAAAWDALDHGTDPTDPSAR